jgi:hypothetical protein
MKLDLSLFLILFLFIYFLTVVKFELRASCLQGKADAVQLEPHLYSFFALVIFAQADLDHQPPILSFPPPLRHNHYTQYLVH